MEKRKLRTTSGMRSFTMGLSTITAAAVKNGDNDVSNSMKVNIGYV